MSSPTLTDFIEVDGMKLPVVVMKCCREWPILLGVQVGRCGDCGERPYR